MADFVPGHLCKPKSLRSFGKAVEGAVREAPGTDKILSMFRGSDQFLVETYIRLSLADTYRSTTPARHEKVASKCSGAYLGSEGCWGEDYSAGVRLAPRVTVVGDENRFVTRPAAADFDYGNEDRGYFLVAVGLPRGFVRLRIGWGRGSIDRPVPRSSRVGAVVFRSGSRRRAFTLRSGAKRAVVTDESRSVGSNARAISCYRKIVLPESGRRCESRYDESRIR